MEQEQREQIEQYAVMVYALEDIKRKVEAIKEQVDFNRSTAYLKKFNIQASLEVAHNEVSKALVDLNNERKINLEK